MPEVRAGRLPGLRRIPPLMRRIDPALVLYNSWFGRISDSPRAIFDELRRRDAPLEHVWIVADGHTAPDGAHAVHPESRRYLELTGRARWIVSNNTIPGYFRKKRGTTYLQTWHGTPLKRIGFDIDRPAFAGSERYLANLRREVTAWDFLVSPNRFSSEIFRGAFRYDGAMLETGYPRNDILIGADREDRRQRARAALGLGEGDCAVLYAPTYRDDATEFSTALDLTGLADALGDSFHVLVRAHNAVASTLALPRSTRLRDVSAHDEVGDLLLAADVLVTDYSSVMFDFAVTGKPMLFFTYDLARYRDELRGFYFDFAREAPGPMLSTTSELVAALRDLDGVRERHADAYARFRTRFCSLEDGGAAARVVDAVFGAAGGLRS